MAGKLRYSDSAWANTRRWLEQMQVVKMNGFHKNPPEDDKRRIVQEISTFLKALETDTTPSGACDRLLLRNAEFAVNFDSTEVGVDWFWTDCLWAVLLLVSGARVFVATRNFE